MDVVKALETMVMGYENNLSEYNPDAYAAHFIIREAIKEINRLRGNFKEKVVALVNTFVDATGEQPTIIHIPEPVEADILRLTYDDIGPLANDVKERGVREAFGKVFGMEVVWDADEFKVERSLIKRPTLITEDKKEGVHYGGSEEKSE